MHLITQRIFPLCSTTINHLYEYFYLSLLSSFLYYRPTMEICSCVLFKRNCAHRSIFSSTDKFFSIIMQPRAWRDKKKEKSIEHVETKFSSIDSPIRKQNWETKKGFKDESLSSGKFQDKSRREFIRGWEKSNQVTEDELLELCFGINANWNESRNRRSFRHDDDKINTDRSRDARLESCGNR